MIFADVKEINIPEGSVNQLHEGNILLWEKVEEPVSYRTVLYTDGTFIINEKSTDQAANEALHGVATNVYAPYNPNGSTDAEKYIFTTYTRRPWHGQRANVRHVEIGSPIAPPSTAYWFYAFTDCTSADLENLDTSAVTNMNHMFYDCLALTSLDVTHFDTSAVTNMNHMFNGCRALTSLDVTHFDTSAVTNMNHMFNGCRALTSLDVTHFDTSAVTNMSYMFYDCLALTSLDVTHFDTSAVTNMSYMFNGCLALATIYASPTFVVSQVTDSGNMFGNMSTNLVGGAGTTWASSNSTNKTYAHIDGGTADPGYFTAKA